MVTKPRTTSLSTDRIRETLWPIIIRENSVYTSKVMERQKISYW